MWAHPGKQLLFMGAEIGQESEWAESRELDWWLLDHPEHRGVHALVRDLNAAYTDTPARLAARRRPRRASSGSTPTTPAATSFSFIRRGATARPTWSACRTSPRSPTRATGSACPSAGAWDEVLNTDAEAYTGSGVGNLGSVTAHEGEWSGQPAHADIVVPPLATIWLRRRA